MKALSRVTAEGWLVLALFLVGVGGIVFMDRLVAAPKLLFGRSLSAIPPSLFPKLVLGGLALLAGALLVTRGRALLQESHISVDTRGLVRALLLFAVMVLYALTMARIGFLISTALALAAVSVIAGNRSVPTILALALIAPVSLYIVSTRGLSVSLPELSPIEFAYARVFHLFEGGGAPAAGGTAAPAAGGGEGQS